MAIRKCHGCKFRVDCKKENDDICDKCVYGEKDLGCGTFRECSFQKYVNKNDGKCSFREKGEKK